MENHLTAAFQRATASASQAAERATGGSSHLKELSSQLQDSAGKSSRRLKDIREILLRVENLHLDCKKDLEEEAALVALLQQLQGNTSGATGRRLRSPLRDTSGATGRRLRSPRRDTSGAFSRRPQSPRHNTSGAAGRRLLSPRRDTSGASSRRPQSPRHNTSGAAGRRPQSPRSSTSGAAGRRQQYQHPYRRPSYSSSSQQQAPLLSGANAVRVSFYQEGATASHAVQATVQQQLALPPPPPPQPQSVLWQRRSPPKQHTPPPTRPLPQLAPLVLNQRAKSPLVTVPKPVEPLGSVAALFQPQPSTGSTAAVDQPSNTPKTLEKKKKSTRQGDGKRKGKDSVSKRLHEEFDIPDEGEDELLKTPNNVAEISKSLQQQKLGDGNVVADTVMSDGTSAQ